MDLGTLTWSYILPKKQSVTYVALRTKKKKIIEFTDQITELFSLSLHLISFIHSHLHNVTTLNESISNTSISRWNQL